jgi:hypothetical protein
MQREWGKSLRYIPSTVIDKGVLKDIPYTSMRAGDFEINIYGDPGDPCGVEIGIHNDLLKSLAAKRNCIDYIQAVLGNQSDRPVVRSMNLEKDVTRRNGLTYEVTPETEADAYGGWWVSVYDEQMLENSRATAAELANITVQKDSIREAEKAEAEAKAKADANAKVESKSTEVAKKTEQAEETKKPTEEPRWTASDLNFSRPISGGASSGSGSVYVRGYTRKDGTYVAPHTRSRPRR